jgi:hypothetical protein
MYKLHGKRQQHVQCVAMMGTLGGGITCSFDQYVAQLTSCCTVAWRSRGVLSAIASLKEPTICSALPVNPRG